MKCVELKLLDSILLAVGNSSFPTAVGSCGIPAARASRVISVARTLIMNMINTMVFFQKTQLDDIQTRITMRRL